MRAFVSPGFSEGHALPALALAQAMIGRGHQVDVELSERWREPVERLGAGFVASEEYVAFPEADARTDAPTVVERARATLDALRERSPDVVLADFTSPAPALAAELAELRLALLVPTIYPVQEPGLPPLLTGYAPPRTRLGALAWRAADPALRAIRPSARWARRVPTLLDRSRAELGLAPLGPHPGPETTYGPIRAGLVLVTTFPQLEYPRRWPESVRVVGPAPFELPHPEIELPAGDDPLVLIASSTVPDPRRRLVRDGLEALADEPVRVVAALNRRGERWPHPIPSNARVVDWVPYSQVMGEASLVVSSGGMGTVNRALTEGVPVMVCPTGADTAENGARVTWAGAGLSLPRTLRGRRAIRLTVRRLLTERRFGDRARELAAWHAGDGGADHGTRLLEGYAAGSSS